MHIQKLELLSLDLTAQRDFYQNVLELPAELNPSGLALQAGSTEILFKQGPLDFEGAYHFAFNIPENQFKAAKKWLTSRIPLLRDKSGREDSYTLSLRSSYEGWTIDAFFSTDMLVFTNASTVL